MATALPQMQKALECRAVEGLANHAKNEAMAFVRKPCLRLLFLRWQGWGFWRGCLRRGRRYCTPLFPQWPAKQGQGKPGSCGLELSPQEVQLVVLRTLYHVQAEGLLGFD